jgi:hypothetical protein
LFDCLNGHFSHLQGCVSRLVKTKKKLPSQTIQIMVSLQEKLSERGNFAQLRKAMEKQVELKEPVIPWFGMRMRRGMSEGFFLLFLSPPSCFSFSFVNGIDLTS